MTATAAPVYSAAVSKLLVRTAPGARGIRSAIRLLWLVATLLLALAACTAGRTSSQEPTQPGHSGQPDGPAHAAAPRASTESTPADPSEGLRHIQAAADLDGRVVGPGSPDTEATLLIVFATWCNPCRQELALVGKLAADTPRLRVLGLNAYEEYAELSDEARLRSFLAENAPWLQVVRASDRLLAALGRPAKIPTLFLFDRHGALVQSYLRAQRRPPNEAELRAAIHRAMQAGGPARP